MINRIFIDIDDVLNTFTPSALRYVGCKIDNYSQYPAECNYNIVKAAKVLGKPFKKKQFWDSLPRELWADVPQTPFCTWLVRAAKKLVGEKNVFLATSPTKSPDCLAGKLDWVHSNLPKWLWRQYVITPRKWLLAQKGALLIDDNTDNIGLFQCHGGEGLLVPRPWNCLKKYDPSTWLHECF